MNPKPHSIAPTAPHPALNVPATLDHLIGRKQELRRLGGMIVRDGVRLVTLTGPPGVGKTRLAIEATARVAPHFGTRAQMVDLAPVTDPALAFPTIARALGRSDERLTVVDWLKRSVQSQPLLLVLDNVEQLLPEFARDLADLLADCPLLTVLVTSREELHVRGERVFPVRPLALPDAADASAAKRSPAIMLFVERAREVVPSFALTPSNAPAVVKICTRLDGLPLAIELAAPRTALFTPQALLARLEHPLELLSDGAVDLPPRHRTLRAAIAWSYNLLDPPEQALLRRLAVFAGGCTEDAAGKVCGLTESTVDGLTSLVRKNLLQVDWTGQTDPDGAGNQTRFTLLETVREYALEKLGGDTLEHSATQERHTTYFLEVVEQAVAAIVRESPGQQQIAALDQLEREHDNLRAALRWAISDAPNAELAARLVKALGWFWFSRGYLNEGWYWAEEALTRDLELHPAMRADIRIALTAMALRRGDFTRALVRANEGVTFLRQTGEHVDLCHLLGMAGQAALGSGDLDRAEELFAESLNIARDVEHPWHIGGGLWGLSQLAQHRGELRQANAMALEALTILSGIGDKQGIVLVMDVLAAAARQAGDLDRSRQLDEESLSLRRELGDRPGTGVSLRGLADVARLRRQDSRARSLYVESIEIAFDLGDLPGTAACLEGLAEIAIRHQRLAWAATLLGAAKQARTRMDMAQPSTATDVAEFITTIQTHLAPEDFTRAWTAGCERPLDVTIGRARTHLVPRPAKPASRTHRPTSLPAQLSRRERQVATLIASGYDNAQIAAQLTLSKRTVETHVSNILRKLEVDSRVGIVLWATDHALTSDGTA